MKSKQKKNPSIFMQEVKRDWNTFRRLRGTQRLRFVWDYFRFKLIAAVVILVILVSASIALYNGQQPRRLRVCVVLNNDDISCKGWFHDFFEELASDGNKARCELNEDQPFDYRNKYYYVQELEVMTTISSYRMDVAICGPDMYDYLLSLNACMPLDTVLSDEDLQYLSDRDMLVDSTAGVRYKEDGTLDETDAVDGCFAVDISDTAFGHEYNDDQDLEDGQEKRPLYAIIISNTDHTDDAVKLIHKISQ